MGRKYDLRILLQRKSYWQTWSKKPRTDGKRKAPRRKVSADLLARVKARVKAISRYFPMSQTSSVQLVPGELEVTPTTSRSQNQPHSSSLPRPAMRSPTQAMGAEHAGHYITVPYLPFVATGQDHGTQVDSDSNGLSADHQSRKPFREDVAERNILFAHLASRRSISRSIDIFDLGLKEHSQLANDESNEFSEHIAERNISYFPSLEVEPAMIDWVRNDRDVETATVIHRPLRTSTPFPRNSSTYGDVDAGSNSIESQQFHRSSSKPASCEAYTIDDIPTSPFDPIGAFHFEEPVSLIDLEDESPCMEVRGRSVRRKCRASPLRRPSQWTTRDGSPVSSLELDLQNEQILPLFSAPLLPPVLSKQSSVQIELLKPTS